VVCTVIFSAYHTKTIFINMLDPEYIIANKILFSAYDVGENLVNKIHRKH